MTRRAGLITCCGRTANEASGSKITGNPRQITLAGANVYSIISGITWLFRRLRSNFVIEAFDNGIAIQPRCQEVVIDQIDLFQLDRQF